MRHTPELERVQERMQPGAITLDGFFGQDDRKLADIIAADEEVVHAKGVKHRQIADRLDELAAEGRDIAEREIPVEARYRVRVRDDRGVLPSPWGDGRFNKAEVKLTDTATGRVFHFNALTTHMIRDHGFYGGRGSDYRIDPAAIIETLELAPEREVEGPPDPPTPENES